MSGGGSKKVTVGYWYRLLYHFGLVRGPVDAFLEFRAGDRTAWKGSLTQSGRISINQPGLWGGEESEGGLQGDLDVMFGEGDQGPNDYLAAQLGTDQPTYRGKLTAVWRGGRWGAMNPYPKKAAMKVRRILKGWDNDEPWYPAAAVVGPGVESIKAVTLAVRYSINIPTSFPAAHANAVATDGTSFIAAFGFGYLGTSASGRDWTAELVFDAGVVVKTVAYGAGRWIIGGSFGRIWWLDGDGWILRPAGLGTSLVNSVAYAAGTWLAVDVDGKISRSLNGGETWALCPSPFSSSINAVAYGGGVWIAVGGGGAISRSPDGGATWGLIQTPLGSSVGFNTVAYANGRWVIGGGTDLQSVPSMLSSDDGGITWKPGTVNGLAVSTIRSVCWADGIWLAVGHIYAIGATTFRIIASVDGANWLAWVQPPGFLPTAGSGTSGTGISYANGRVVITVAEGSSADAAGSFGKILVGELPALPLLAMNAAHILYDSITAEDMQGEPRAMINDASFKAAADQLLLEGFGLCTEYDASKEDLEAFQQRICDVIGACLTQSNIDGLYYLDLIRGSYTLSSLPIISTDDIVEFSREPSVLTELPNQVTVEWFDPQQKSDRATPPVQAMGAIQAAGKVIPDVRKYPEIPTEQLALRVADRDLQAVSTPLSRFRLTLNRRTFDMRPGRAFRLQYPAEGIADMVCMLGDIDGGTLTDGRVRIVAVQDVFRFSSSVYVAAEPGLAQPPDELPATSPHQLLIEAPYIELVVNMTRADLQALPDDVGMVMTIATASSNGLNYLVNTAAEGEEYEGYGSAEWCPTAVAAAEAGFMDDVVGITSVQGMRDIEVGTWALWDSEIVRVDAISDSSVTLGRGCADTTRQLHAAGSRIFFCGDWAGSDGREYVEGESVRAKLLTRTGSAAQAIDAAPEHTVVMAQRFNRPYAPGQLRINGVDYPTGVALGTGAVMTWAHRDRLLQSDQLVDAGMGSIGPEPGVQYLVRVTALDGSLLPLGEVMDELVDGTTYTVTASAVAASEFGGAPFFRIGVRATRSGVNSWAEPSVVVSGLLRAPTNLTAVAEVY